MKTNVRLHLRKTKRKIAVVRKHGRKIKGRNYGSYNVFVRNWWKENPSWPQGLEPHAGNKSYLQKGVSSESEAREIAQRYNALHKPGRLSRKAEYESN